MRARCRFRSVTVRHLLIALVRRAGQRPGGGVVQHQGLQLRERSGIIRGARGPERGPVRRGIRHPDQRPVRRRGLQPAHDHRAPVTLIMLFPCGAQHDGLQFLQRLRAGRLPPLAEGPGRRRPPVPRPRRQRQVPGQRQDHLPGIRVGHQRHQDDGAQHECRGQQPLPSPSPGRPAGTDRGRSLRSPAVAGQNTVAQLIGGQLPRRDLDEKGQIIGTRLQALGPHRRQSRRDRVLPL